MAPSLSHIGQPRSRVDGKLKVTGAAKYAAEYQADELLHGFVVISTIAAGRIVAIDTREARAMPGVVEIFTHLDRQGVSWWDRDWQDETAPPGHPFRPLHSDRILFDGQPIALVIAESFEAARNAAAVVHVLYEVEKHQTNLRVAEPDQYVPPKKRQNVPPPPEPRGDLDRALAEAPFRVDAEYEQPSEHHNPMELFASTVIFEEGDKLTIYDKTQGSQNAQQFVSAIFGLKDVKVVNAYVGGAFGSGLRPRHQLFLAVMAALKLKRSVRVELSRREMFYLSYRPITLQKLSLGADSTGKLLALKHHAVQATSMFEDYQEVVVNWSGLAYQCDNAEFSYALSQVNTDTPGDMRAPGATTGVFALETAMDELAYAVGIDPLELRLRNYADRDQNMDKQFTSKALRECYAEGAERFGWSARQAAPRSMREGKELVGYGMATGFWDAQVNKAEAKVRLLADGSVEVLTAATDIGTGTYTILAQIAAEAFDVPIDRVKVSIGASDLPTSPVEGGSWMAASVGSAVHMAAEAIKTKLIHRANRHHEAFLPIASADLCVEAGMVKKIDGTGPTISVAELMQSAGWDAVEETGKAGPDMLQMQKYISYTHSAVFVEVRVDEQLGVARVKRIVSAIAAGKILNPKTARSQILGGVVMGVGMAMHEEGLFDHGTGRIMNHNLAEYHVPANADIEDIDVIFVDEHDDKVNPIGVKGLGEIGIVGVAAAIGNAIYHATGKRLRHLPFTIDKIIG
ncbi:xanthine dehydrogenase family protein molybdopterin-binding subunit [Devosia rhizoryzae]|uniref:Xanthine dehydrogenase family protein molybdopterin-binding subunit n=1 Tax=Devosia rhizoryzae TaxID=2774137 RepID=A0ABX7C7W4_9HYPH|nr:xanthine dehydrogenase family protein molybdopterin-binding subunit [Devosia rhizoryzae]QQR38051.1 xanthine dehydrogenase family protein molybdopterin-binding subunit [Devosia rhizoryzae]